MHCKITKKRMKNVSVNWDFTGVDMIIISYSKYKLPLSF